MHNRFYVPFLQQQEQFFRSLLLLPGCDQSDRRHHFVLKSRIQDFFGIILYNRVKVPSMPNPHFSQKADLARRTLNLQGGLDERNTDPIAGFSKISVDAKGKRETVCGEQCWS